MSANCQRIIAFIDEDDPPGTVERRVERWKAGEEVEGLHGDPYERGDYECMVIKFVSTKQAQGDES
jgi:hypothetical protein